MKKNIARNPLWPDWYNGKKIDEVQFGRAFLEQWPLKCVNGTLYTLDGPVEDESEIKQRILENIEEYVTSGLSKKVTNILETIKLLAFSDPFPIEQDCIHFQNGVYHLPDGTIQESRLFCQNRPGNQRQNHENAPKREQKEGDTLFFSNLCKHFFTHFNLISALTFETRFSSPLFMLTVRPVPMIFICPLDMVTGEFV